jgi:hypothetical protein
MHVLLCRMLLFAIDMVANAKRGVLTTLTTPLPQEQQLHRVCWLRLAACDVSYTVAGAMEDNEGVVSLHVRSSRGRKVMAQHISVHARLDLARECLRSLCDKANARCVLRSLLPHRTMIN